MFREHENLGVTMPCPKCKKKSDEISRVSYYHLIKFSCTHCGHVFAIRQDGDVRSFLDLEQGGSDEDGDRG